MKRIIFSALLLAVWGAGFGARAETNALAVARAALRDGLWSLARDYAGRDASTNAQCVILESFAREDRWEDVARVLKTCEASDSRFAYYRAVLDKDYARAAKLLEANGSEAGLVEARLMRADLCVKAGDRAAAEKLWREIAATTNASEHAFATACVSLDETELLRMAYARVRRPALRRLVGLRLGRALLREAKTRAEGERLIRSLVRDAPDAEGAREAFLKMADVAVADGRWQDAVEVFRDAVEVWPAAAQSAAVQESYGFAVLRAGRRRDALTFFARAHELAADDEMRARTLLRRGDVLTEIDRGPEALACYRTILEKYPKTVVGRDLKRIVDLREREAHGRTLYRDYRFADAQKVFAEVGAADPVRKYQMAFFETLCLYGLGKDKAAAAKAGELAAQSDDLAVRAEAERWLAKFAYNAGNWKESGRRFRNYAAEAPTDAAASEALAWAARAALSGGEYAEAIATASDLITRYPASPAAAMALLAQGEALIELSRFGEAVLVLERAALSENLRGEDRMRAELLKADAFFAMGADDATRYEAALKSYRDLAFRPGVTPSQSLSVGFKIGRTLEKLKRTQEAIDQYYTQVVLTYRDGRQRGETFDDEACAAFSRAAFRLADAFEGQGKDYQAASVLRLVATSDVPAAEEAKRRLDRLESKGRFL